jgi:hypothetical protein
MSTYAGGAAMDSGDLTPQQAAKMRDALTPCVRWLHKLQRRMELRGFPLTDELFQAAAQAYDAAHALTMKLHYLSCKSGVGRSADRMEQPEKRERKHGRYRSEP